jgi:integrase
MMTDEVTRGVPQCRVGLAPALLDGPSAGAQAARDIVVVVRGLVPYRQRWRPPFLYTDTDIAALIAAAEAIEPPFRAATYRTLPGLLAAAGLRIGEAISLDGDDIDWTQGVLLIRESKFGKSRLVPLHDSVNLGAARVRHAAP